MTYEETCEWLFHQTANYESQGQGGYKASLDNMHKLDEYYKHPHNSFKSIHVGGTNGKGSVSHTIAALLQVCGYKVGLYTSPHLADFSERIRINGQPFFEIATAMAFKYFSDNNIDIAVVEVGLGGRLDSTNIITPVLSVITNISLDHTQILGSSLEQIAMEKGGIIKDAIPVVIGETTPETRPIFDALAQQCDAPIIYAEEMNEIEEAEFLPEESGIYYKTKHLGSFKGQLCGQCQVANAKTIAASLDVLSKLGFLSTVTSEATRISIQKEVSMAFLNVCDITGLKGRWQVVSESPMVVCDTGHNTAGWKYLSQQLNEVKCNNMYIVFGVVEDKDIDGIMALLPKHATYFFTKTNSKRAVSEHLLQMMGQQIGLNGNAYPSVEEAYSAVEIKAKKGDFVFIGGSSYVVADFLKNCL